MKKILPITLLALFFASLTFLNFSHSAEEQALKKVSDQFAQGLEELESAIEEYKVAVEFLENDTNSIHELQTIHLNTRLSYKRIEFLLEYLDPFAIKKLINGAPLPTLEPNVPEIHVLEPTGLQVLDELVFGEDVFAEKEAIHSQINQLAKDYDKVKTYQGRVKLTHRHVFEASRKEILRIFTLGLTGFDTPGSVNAIPEAKESFEAVYKAMLPYFPLIKDKSLGIALNLSGHFDIAFEFFKKYDDFDSFDRLQFLRKVVNPLYAFIYDAHTTLGVEQLSEVSDLPVAVNFHSREIFSDDFLNKNYYSNLNVSKLVGEKRAALGRLLFFDPVLSANNQRSCASCHQPEKGFTDGLPKSLAYDGKGHIKRNSPTILNSLYSTKYFYDLREHRLDRQVKHVMVDSLEFATDYNEIVGKLGQSKEYKKLFKEAYKDQAKYSLSVWSVSNALASYVASLTSFNSPFDQYVRGETNRVDPAVKRGFNLFMGKAACGTCHFAPTFNGSVPPAYTDAESEILGVPSTPTTDQPPLDSDIGRLGNKLPKDESVIYKHSFKTVTIRNIALTAPYMHNGVYQTLEEVVDFYNRGGGAGMGTEVPYQTLPDAALDLTEQEQQDLIRFMESLTDNPWANDLPERLPRFEEQTDWNDRKIGGTY